MKRHLAVASLLSILAIGASAAEGPTWVEASNAHAQVLIKAQGRFNPEGASSLGFTEYDGQALDLGPEIGARFRAATAAAQAELEKRLLAEQDARVRQDLEIMIQAAKDQIQGSVLNERYMLAWTDVPQQVFLSEQSLLQEQFPAERRIKALERLQRYTGLAPGSVSLFEQAKARYTERLADKTLLGPYAAEIEQALENAPTYASGVRELYQQFKIDGAEPALKALDRQIKDYAAWARKNVLPRARKDARLPAELYAFSLRQFGIDIDPQTLMQRARLEFMETRAAMQALAPLVAKANGIAASDYRDVIRALKTKKVENAAIETYYRGVLDQLDQIILREKIVSLPQRPLIMRVASAAESAAQPAPYFQPAPLVGNTGEQGTFVLPMGNPGKGSSEQYDDFNFAAAAWTLSAHEGRPGHELQFSAMIERGVSLARSVFAFNSVNAEGWGLYAEAEALPYEPLEGQLIALQFRLLRAARAMLDPMLNLGLTDREAGRKLLTGDVVLSEPMARQELDRYMFRAPGQAGSYFYGYTRLLELRAETELALGAKFQRLAFNDFLLDQGLLPPALLAKSVREEFVPAKLK